MRIFELYKQTPIHEPNEYVARTCAGSSDTLASDMFTVISFFSISEFRSFKQIVG